MKKNIVFVIPSLGAGGGEKSLINVLTALDYSIYNVDVIVFDKSGLFLNLIPPQVTLFELPGNYQIFKKGLLDSLLGFLMAFNFRLFYYRALFAIKNKISKKTAVTEQNTWRYVSASIPNFTKEYDAAIGFLEKSSNYLVVDKITSKIKVGWIHTNYSTSGMSADFDQGYFQKLDYVVTVSAECVLDLQNNFPSLKEKFRLIHNIVSSSLILKLANQGLENEIFTAKNLLVTVARLSLEKGIDLAVEAAKILKEQGHDFQWIVIGAGVERDSLMAKIREYNLTEHFILLGLKQNPYPYVARASVYIQPSRYEGKSIAIDEAKILGKPLIVTDYTSAKDQIENGVNGLIAATHPNALANSIVQLLENEKLREKFILHLKNENLDTTSEIIKLNQLINESY